MPTRTHPVPNPALHASNRALAVSIGPTNVLRAVPERALLRYPSLSKPTGFRHQETDAHLTINDTLSDTWRPLAPVRSGCPKFIITSQR